MKFTSWNIYLTESHGGIVIWYGQTRLYNIWFLVRICEIFWVKLIRQNKSVYYQLQSTIRTIGVVKSIRSIGIELGQKCKWTPLISIKISSVNCCIASQWECCDIWTWHFWQFGPLEGLQSSPIYECWFYARKWSDMKENIETLWNVVVLGVVWSGVVWSVMPCCHVVIISRVSAQAVAALSAQSPTGHLQ